MGVLEGHDFLTSRQLFAPFALVLLGNTYWPWSAVLYDPPGTRQFMPQSRLIHLFPELSKRQDNFLLKCLIGEYVTETADNKPSRNQSHIVVAFTWKTHLLRSYFIYLQNVYFICGLQVKQKLISNSQWVSLHCPIGKLINIT